MNQVASKKEGALAVNMFEADADKGSQNMTQEDLALPFLKVLGQLSPEEQEVAMNQQRKMKMGVNR